MERKSVAAVAPASPPVVAQLVPALGLRRAVLAFSLAAVAVFVAATYWPVLSAKAIAADDGEYVLQNPLVRSPGWNSAQRFFGEVWRPSTVSSYYQPLTMVSLMLDSAVGGSPETLLPFRRTNLVLHTVNALLVGLLIYGLFGRPLAAALAALLFGVHPLTVESVAWLSERKTLLATFFALLCILSYVFAARRRSVAWYAASLVALVLALLCKPTTVSVPLVLIGLDFWPLRRLSWRALAAKTPFLIMAGMSAFVARASQASAGGLIARSADLLTLPLVAAYDIAFYLQKVIWPAGIIFWYPIPEPLGLENSTLVLGAATTAALAAAGLLLWRRIRAIPAALLLFVLALLPALASLSVTDAIVANRYVYYPLIALAILVGSALSAAAARPRLRIAVPLIALALTPLLILQTRFLVDQWQNSEKLNRYMLQYAPQSGQVHFNLAGALFDQGRLDEALPHFEAATHSALPSTAALAHLQVGIILVKQNHRELAAEHLLHATRNSASAGRAYAGLGVLQLDEGRTDEALNLLERAIAHDPALPTAYGALGKAAAIARSPAVYARVIPHFEARVRREPNSTAAREQLGLVHADYADLLVQLERLPEAVDHYRAALKLNQRLIDVYLSFGALLEHMGRPAEAGEVYEAGLRTAPGDAQLRQALSQLRGRARPPG